MTTEWEGWSSDWEQVDQTRVLAQLLGGNSTEPGVATVPAAIKAAHLNREPDPTLIEELFCGVGLFTQMTTPYGGTILGLPLATTPAGYRAAGEFRRASERRVKAPAVRRAVLLWLDEHRADGLAELSTMLTEPHSWFYGTQFTSDELSAAATNLAERGYVKILTEWGGQVLRAALTSTGTSCAERHGGDPDQMETSMTSGHQFNIGSYTQQGGAAAFGSTVGTQSANTIVTIGETAADLVALLEAVKAMNGIPGQAQDEADKVTAELQAAAAGTAEPAKAIGRAKTFFHWLQQFADPATQAVLTAAGNYAALRLGIASS